MSERADGPPAPLGCVCGGTDRQATGLARGAGESWAAPASSNRRKPPVTGLEGVPASRTWHRRGEVLQGMRGAGCALPVGLLPARHTHRLRLQVAVQQLEISRETEGLIRQCFEIVGCMVLCSR